MKKVSFLLCGLLVLLFNSTVVSAEDPSAASSSESNMVSTRQNNSVDSSITDAQTSETSSSSLPNDDIGITLRQALLDFVPYYGTTKELIDGLSDEQLEYAKQASLNLGAQAVSETSKFLVKIYGPNPIPKESYSLNYKELTAEEMKQHIPQIRLSLIYGYDLDKNLVNGVSDQQFLDMINNYIKDDNNFDIGIAVLYDLKDNITSGNYNTNTNESSKTNNSSSSLSSSTSTTQSLSSSTDKKIDPDKKETLPHTGEQKNRLFTIGGLSIFILLIVITFTNKKKKHS